MPAPRTYGSWPRVVVDNEGWFCSERCGKEGGGRENGRRWGAWMPTSETEGALEAEGDAREGGCRDSGLLASGRLARGDGGYESYAWNSGGEYG